MQMGGSQLRAQQTVDELELIQIDRVLTDDESSQLERALRRLGPKRDIWRWSAKDDLKLKLLIKRRAHKLRSMPFKKNDEVQRIAEEMGRSYLAVHKRIQRLRKKFDLPKQPLVYDCSDNRGKAPYVPLERPPTEGTICEEEAARILGVTVAWLRRHRAKGVSPEYVTFAGKFYRYREAAVRAFPIKEVKAALKRKATIWRIETAKMDPQYVKCPSATDGGEA